MYKAYVATKCICCTSSRLDKSPAVLMPFVAKRVFDHEPVEITPEWGIRDLRSGMAYTLCNSLQCQECGVLFLDYRFSDEQMACLYAGYRDERYTQQREHYEPGYAAVNAHYECRAPYILKVERWLADRLPIQPAVLDWGGATGINAPFLGNGKVIDIFDISGIEPVEGARVVSLSQARQQTYDVITCCQVLEHVADPFGVIEQLTSLLKQNTLLYLEVPLEGLFQQYPASRELAPKKRHWHEHINFFSIDALNKMVQRAGLSVLDTQVLEVKIGQRSGWVTGLVARLT